MLEKNCDTAKEGDLVVGALEIILTILSAIGTFYSVLKFYRKFYYAGVLYNQKFRKTNNFHKYGICIPGRNEEKVIRNLLDSIQNQDFPHEKLTIFVCADNCTDKTAEIAKQFAKESDIETIVFEHKNPDERTKGFALRYLFDQIKQTVPGGVKSCEAYFIFDADNVLAPDYFTRMNEAYDEGNEVITSFRNSKNIDQNWISFSYATHWLRTCLGEHRGKNLLGLSCRIQGTGFCFSNKYVENGWRYTSLTEDRAFCTDVVVQGGRVVYCEAARFYDEQPYKLKVALKQRLRWAKGHLQSSVENEPKLLKNIFKFNKNSIRSFDTFWLNFPTAIESGCRRLFRWTIQIIIGILVANAWNVVAGILISVLTSYLNHWIKKMLEATFVYCFYHKYMPKINVFKLFHYIFMFPFFDKIGTWSSYFALFKKVEWKPIPHDYTVDVHKLK